MSLGEIDSLLLSILVCPQDHSELRIQGEQLCCAGEHRYPIVSGVPVFLLVEKEQTIGISMASLRAAGAKDGDPLYLDTVGVSEQQRHGIEQAWSAEDKVDAVISYLVGATCGNSYANLVGQLPAYPIPEIPVGYGKGKLLLDVGSSWGRWSVSAARKGWRVVGIDPSLGAILAAKRAFSRSGLDLAFVCGDARFMPFRADIFDCVFSYSVIQHFSETDAETAAAEVGRVLRHGGRAQIQMAHKGGLRSTYSRLRRDYRESGSFRVRYWSLTSLGTLFEGKIGPSILRPEAFGGLGLLEEDRNYVAFKAKILIYVSVLLKKLSVFLRPLIYLADSVYVISTKR